MHAAQGPIIAAALHRFSEGANRRKPNSASFSLPPPPAATGSDQVIRAATYRQQQLTSRLAREQAGRPPALLRARCAAVVVRTDQRSLRIRP
jgi:hypothetical protein